MASTHATHSASPPEPQRRASGEDGFEATIAENLTLKDHLESQLTIAALGEEDRLICVALIDGPEQWKRGVAPVMGVSAVLGVAGVYIPDTVGCMSLRSSSRLPILAGFH